MRWECAVGRRGFGGMGDDPPYRIAPPIIGVDFSNSLNTASDRPPFDWTPSTVGTAGLFVSAPSSSTYVRGSAAAVSLDHLIEDAATAAVEKAIRDPALLAAAIMRLSPLVRDQIRVLLDALESGSPRP